MSNRFSYTNKVTECSWQPQIIVFENGQIVQQGKHSDLIGVNGYYKELFEKQQADQS